VNPVKEILMKHLTRRCARPLHIALAALVALFALPVTVFAAMPAMEPPSRGPSDNIIETLQNYGFDIVMVIAFLVISAMFVGVVYHAYTTYSEIHTGRKTWGEFGLTVAAGAILLVLGIWLLTTAIDIL
jgi:integrating conjugative element membrane protein (TIGR03745 family)